MLKVIDTLAEIDFRQLMDVYEQGIAESGKIFYPNEPENLQILYAEQDFYAYLEEFFKDPSSCYVIWLAQSRYAAALRIERYQDGLLLNALETKPSLRGNGYAKQLILAVIDSLRSKGNGILYSHIEKSNEASLKVHLACGFQICCNYAVYLDGSEHPDSYTLSIKY